MEFRLQELAMTHFLMGAGWNMKHHTKMGFRMVIRKSGIPLIKWLMRCYVRMD